ncbi:MAG: hypothetical protein JWO59_301 [Chloroflexi bacterium]|nr:hypothetical protein [Chloroflexota bacterium]
MLSPLGDDRVHPSADHARRRVAPPTDTAADSMAAPGCANCTQGHCDSRCREIRLGDDREV